MYMKTNQYKEIELPIDTYISDVEPFLSGSIPNKSIIRKTVTGCGITTFEIRFAKHHSIIILPNVPVIEGKVDEHNNKFPNSTILGVHKGIDVDDIKAYFTAPAGGFKFLSESAQQQLNILSAKYPKIVEAHRLIGLKGLDATEYDTFAINKTVAATKKQNQIFHLTPIVHAALENYSNVKPIEDDDLYSILSTIYDEQNITFKVAAAHVKYFYKARRTINQSKNVYIIGDKLYPQPIQK